MMVWFLIGFLLPLAIFAAPPPINRLALFPDKSAWCEAKKTSPRSSATAAANPSPSRTGRVWDSASATASPTPSRSPPSRSCTATPACRPSPCGTW
ncbi:unnamed protein product [Staurois parvus]|uniref:Secreted protein n=1 Tax=Staurois parvus TaxID=386267 RepID=A0ABN9C8T0_9NEOB|nr:unnamed protein product [Staurois parvus]